MRSPTSRWLIALLLVGLFSVGTPAHHIMGIPHYSYDENYPQAPVITYKVMAGPYVVELTGYPGKPAPHELSQMHAYIYQAKEKTRVFPGPIQARVERDRLGEQEVVFGPVDTRFDENLHKFSPVYQEPGVYRVRLEMQLEGQPYEIDFPIEVGYPGNPLWGFAGWIAGLVLLVVIIRATKIKMTRRRALAGA